MNAHSGGGSQTAEWPSWMQPIGQGAVNQGIALQNQNPLTMFAGFNPRGVSDLGNLTKWGLEDVASLRQVQPGALGAYASLATMPEIASRPVETPGAEKAQYSLLDSVVGGPVGSSPATQQGMKAWEQYVKPVVENEASNMGLGRSGPGLEAVAQSATMAYNPLVQQELANRMSAIASLQVMADAETQRGLVPRQQVLDSLNSQVQGFLQLSEQQFNQQTAAIEEAFRGGKITEDKKQQLLDSAYDEFLRLQDMTQSVTSGLLGSVIPASIGSRSKQSQTGFGLSK